MQTRHFIAAVAIVLTLSGLATGAPPSAVPKPLSVNELAAKPDALVGKVAVVGRVASATPGKGFVLIDADNCSNCTTECLTDKATKKVPFLWRGAAPATKAVVRVDGTLEKTPKGFALTAQRVTPQ